MMMDVKNSQGRTVSLLNDELPRLSNLPALTSSSSATTTKQPTTSTNPHSTSNPSRYSPPTLQHHYSSDSSSSSASARSSYSSLQAFSPSSNPPSLSRSTSSDDSHNGQSPSPLTPPSVGFDNLRELRKNLPRKFSSTLEGLPSLSTLREQQKIPPTRSSMDFTNQNPLGNDFTFASTGAPMFDPMVTAPLPQAPVTSAGFDQTIAQQIPNVTPTQQVFPTPITTPKSSAKKNQYPCPLSKQYNCGEFFTTSGHAARHAKKHTGKKDAICPDCGKGFTRKDNMEQHRRTHSGGRNKSNSTNSESSTNSKPAPSKDSEETKARQKVRQQQRKSRPSSISTAAPPTTQITPPAMSLSMQQPMPITTQTVLPPQGDMLDPALRENSMNAFFSPTADMSMGFGFPMPQTVPGATFPAPQAPMAMNSRTRGSSSPQQGPTGGGKPISPSAAPREAGLDKLDILAEASSRRSSE